MATQTYYPSETRGDSNIGWLHGRHSFSIGPFHDPARMAFGALKVLNDDIVQPQTGFGTHGHQNIEIISIPIKGVITHQDNTGKEGRIAPGEVQVMSAGTGIRHSEYNDDLIEPINFLQVWISPNQQNVQPRYQQVSTVLQANVLSQIVSPNPHDEGAWIYQDAWIHQGWFDGGYSHSYNLKNDGNGVYVFVINGVLEIGGQVLKSRDAVALTDIRAVDIQANQTTDFILIEVPV